MGRYSRGLYEAGRGRLIYRARRRFAPRVSRVWCVGRARTTHHQDGYRTMRNPAVQPGDTSDRNRRAYNMLLRRNARAGAGACADGRWGAMAAPQIVAG